MKPTQKTIIQKDQETAEQNPKKAPAAKAEKAANSGWDERFWIQPKGLKTEQEEATTPKLPAAKSKKYKDVKSKVATIRSQQRSSYNPSSVGDLTGKFTQIDLNSRRYTNTDNMKEAMQQVASA